MKQPTAAATGAILLCTLSAQAMAEDGDTREVVVTATRIERELFQTPHAATVIDEQTLHDANAASTPDLLRYAGVYVQKTNQGGGSPFLGGLTGKQVLILVDGIRLNNSYYRYGPHQYLNTIDPDSIERIEVVRGPGSVLYGSDALGGTINVITRRRKEFADGNDLDSSLWTHAQSAAEASAVHLELQGNVDDIGFLGGIRYADYGAIDGGGDIGEQRPSGYEARSGDIKLNWLLNEQHELIVGHQYVRQYDVPKTSEVTLGDKLQFNYEPQERMLSWLELRSMDLGPFAGGTFTISHQRQREGEHIIARSAPNVETQELTEVSTLGASIQLHTQLGSAHRLTYGFEYYTDDYSTRKQALDLRTEVRTRLAPGTPNGATYDSLGAYVQDEIRLAERAEVIAGVRYSRFEADGEIGVEALALTTDNFTGSLHGLYRLTPHINLTAGIAQGFRAPNMEDFFGRVDFVSEVPNTQLEPEESLTREVGMKVLAGPFAGDLFYFDTNYEGFIDRVTIAPGVRQRQNIADSNIRGVEATLRYRFANWLLAANAMWARGEDERTGAPLRRIPPFNGNVRLRHYPTERFWWEAAFVMADRQDRLAPGDLTDPRIPVGGTPGYAVIDLSSSLRPFDAHELLLTVENILDKQYKTHGSGIYAPGRSFNLGYRMSFE